MDFVERFWLEWNVRMCINMLVLIGQEEEESEVEYMLNRERGIYFLSKQHIKMMRNK